MLKNRIIPCLDVKNNQVVKGINFENLIEADLSKYLANPSELGRVKRLEDARGRYIEFVKNSFARDKNLSGLKI